MRRRGPLDCQTAALARDGVVLMAALAFGPAVRLSAQSFEDRLLAIPDSASMRAMSRDLTRLPHMAGTPAQAGTRDYVIEKLRSWGLESWTKEYTVYLPQPEIVAAWVIARPGPAAVPPWLRAPA